MQAEAHLKQELIENPTYEILRCRFCAEEKNLDDLLDLSDEHEKLALYSNLIEIFKFDFVNLYDTKLPRTLCDNCCDEFQAFHDFVTKVKNSQIILKNLYYNFEVKEEHDVENSTLTVEIEKEHGVENSSLTQPRLFEIEILKTEQKTEKQTDIHLEPTNIHLMPKDQATEKKYNCVESDQNTCVETGIVNQPKAADSSDCDDDHMSVDDEEDTQSVSWVVHKKANYALRSWSNYPWSCRHCGTRFGSMEEVRCHSKEVHSRCFGFKCAYCDDQFNTFNAFIEHVRRHLDVLSGDCNGRGSDIGCDCGRATQGADGIAGAGASTSTSGSQRCPSLERESVEVLKAAAIDNVDVGTASVAATPVAAAPVAVSPFAASPGADAPIEEQIFVPAVSEETVIVPEEVEEFGTDAEVERTDIVVEPRPSVSSTPTTRRPGRAVTGPNDEKFGESSSDWINDVFVDIESEDDDYDTVLGIPLNTRSATDDPADDYGLTLEQIAVLQAEEEADDLCVRNLCIRNLAPSDDFFEFKWTCDRQTFTGKREVFTGTPGPTFPVASDTTPFDIFYKMFDTDFIDMLVRQTNRYAEQTLTRLRQDPDCKKLSRSLRWTPTDRNEMVAFLAVIILQGLYPKANAKSYFSYDGFGTTPFFRSVMSYNRYYLLKTFFHFMDNQTTHDTSKLNKVRPVVDYFNNKFSSLYYPEQNVVIDERMLNWHGQRSFAQKIAMVGKVDHVGVKIYELCESSSGYLWQFRVYTGKDRSDLDENRQDQNRSDMDMGSSEGCPNIWPLDHDYFRQDLSNRQRDRSDRQRDRPDRQRDRPDRLPSESSDVRPSNATAKIVYDLVEPLLHQGHTLTMDNFYNSPLLARCLKKDNTDVYGTLRLSREFVPESLKTMTKTEMRKGEVAVSYCSDLAVMLWRDANVVSMISTYHPLHVATSGMNNRVVSKPAIVLDYNKSIGGVDRKDQYLSGQKTKVWYKKLFRRLCNAALFNCFVIYNSRHKLTHRRFRTVLAEDLLRVHKSIDLTTEPKLIRDELKEILEAHQSIGNRPYVASNHFPIRTGSKATRCWMCSRNKLLTRTSFKCEECDVNLCIVVCFKAYHKPFKHSAQYFCQYCNKKFKSDYECVEHALTHWSNSQRICSYCGEIFPSADALEKHRKVFYKQASVCRRDRRKQPRMVCDGSGSWREYEWTCQECWVRYPDVDSLRSHLQQFHKKCFAMKCQDCLKVVPNYHTFVSHVTGHRPYLKKYCPYCNQYYQNATEMSMHVSNHLNSEQKPCNGCGQTFGNKAELLEHFNQFVPQRPYGSWTKEELTCNICQMVFKYVSGLQSHKRNVHGPARKPNHVCDTCGKAYTNKYDFDVHVKLHTGVNITRNEVCRVCEKTFTTKKFLKKHIRTHMEKVYKYSCDECGKSFRTKFCLKSHVISHYSVQFQCIVCQKAFKSKTGYNTHMNIHNGLRPYSCQHCEKTFTNWGNCNKHMMRIHRVTLAKTKLTPQGRVSIDKETGQLQELLSDEKAKDWMTQMLMPSKRAQEDKDEGEAKNKTNLECPVGSVGSDPAC